MNVAYVSWLRSSRATNALYNGINDYTLLVNAKEWCVAFVYNLMDCVHCVWYARRHIRMYY